MALNYQPASWEDTMVFPETDVAYSAPNYPQTDLIRDVPSSQRPQRQTRRWVDRSGRHCYLVCEPPPARPQNLRFVARQILGLPINVARQRFPGVVIRVVIRNGQHLPTTLDLNENRINVETRNWNGREVITRIVGFN